MIELKGWIEISPSIDGEETTRSLEFVVGKIGELIEPLKEISNQFLEIINAHD